MKNPAKPSCFLVESETRQGMHFVANCPVCGELEIGTITQPTSSKEKLIEEQLYRLKKNPLGPASRHLIYLNLALVGSSLNLNGGEILAHCPECGTDYKITREDFNSAYRDYHPNPE